MEILLLLLAFHAKQWNINDSMDVSLLLLCLGNWDCPRNWLQQNEDI